MHIRFDELWPLGEAPAHILGIDFGEKVRHMFSEARARLYGSPVPDPSESVDKYYTLYRRMREAALNFPERLPITKGPIHESSEAVVDKVKPVDAIRWAIDQGDIEVCPECRDWYLRNGLPSVREQLSARRLEWWNFEVDSPKAVTDIAHSEDAELGRNVRHQRQEMADRMHAENQARVKYTAPLIAERDALVAQGKNKSQASRIVAARHPEENINPESFRQK